MRTMARKKPWPVRLKELRERLGTPGKPITQAEAAERCGVALRTWINWENAHRTPGGPALHLLRRTFPDLDVPELD